MTIRILAISDEVSDLLYDTDLLKSAGSFDAVLSCGDLPYSYMEYIVTQVRTVNAYYVHGNHDASEDLHSGETINQPGGWHDLDRRTVAIDGGRLLVAGLEGSIRYNRRGQHQYTDLDMLARAQALVLQLWMNKIRYGRYLDVLIAHSPARGIHDSDDGAHRGFEVLRAIIRRYRPRLFLHGHQHHYGPTQWRTRYVMTDVINVHPFRLVEMNDTGVQVHRLQRSRAI